QLNKKAPVDLALHFGAGQARLDLGSLDLPGVELDMGVGQLDMDLRGAPRGTATTSPSMGVSAKLRFAFRRMPGFMPRPTAASAASASAGSSRRKDTGSARLTKAPRTRSTSRSRAVSGRST